MYHLYGFDENVANICALSAKYGNIKTGEGLRKAYKIFLDYYQPKIPHPNPPFPHLVDETHAETAAVQKALFNLSKKSPQLYTLLTMAIHTLFLRDAKNSGGGSTSNAIGVIWINNKESWSLQDMEELLIHELTHNLVFIDELCHLHIKDYTLLPKKENFAKSAILHIRRPLDKVFHSIVVSMEILLSREFFLGEPKNPKVHPPSALMKKDLMDAIDSVCALPNVDSLLTARGSAILGRCKDTIAQMENTSIPLRKSA